MAKADSSELKELKRNRGVLKGKLTLFKKYVTSIELPISAETCIDLELRIERIKSVFDEFENVQDRIETICTDIDAQLLERESTQNTYYENVAIAKRAMNDLLSQNSSFSANVTTTEQENSTSIKFPDIKLPSFNGDITQWLEFRDTFDALINQSNLKPIQKFKYLRSCLQDSALIVIGSLEYCEESHAIAWKLLCERFNNPKKLVANHLKALLHVDQISNTSSALRGFLDNISKHLRVLSKLNISTENWDNLLIFMLAPKLDSQTLRKWEEKSNSNELPSLQDFKSFLRSRADLLESMSSSDLPSDQGQAKNNATRKAMVTTSTSNSNSSYKVPNSNTYSNRCPYCENPHYINQCQKFLALSVRSRIQTARNLRLCTNCLRSGHLVSNCRASSCRTCKGKHNTLLHITHTPTNTAPTNPSNTDHTPTTLNLQSAVTEPRQSLNLHTTEQTPNIQLTPIQNKTVILSTALVKVIDTDNQSHTLRALLDSGSQSNFITENAFKKLNLPKIPINMQVTGFNESVTCIDSSSNITIHSQTSTFSRKISCLIVPTICNQTPHETINLERINFPKKYRLADTSFYKPSEIDLLLGVELFYDVLCSGQYRLGKGLPILQNTQFGWVVSGSIPTQTSTHKTHCNFVQSSELRGFWGEDTKPPHDELRECERIFQTHTRNSDGNFVVKLPLKAPPSELGQSRHIVYKRFKTLESKFARDPTYKKQYVNFMREFEQAGHMIKRDTYEPCNYLPHHAVVNPEKTTTPLRVVIDASFKTSTGVSLNDIQYKGTMNQDKLTNILLKFRINKYVINADVEKLYRFIYLHPSQHNLQCILWRENPTDPLLTYTLTTLSFGLKCAPYIATRCLQQLAEEYMEQYPEAAAAILTEFYIDDWLHSGDDEQKVIDTAGQVERILRSANFHLRKWKSNSSKILHNVSNPYTNTTQPNNTCIPTQEITKLLGISWNSHSDYITYSLKIKPLPSVLTKRNILSSASEIFDPLGLIAPVLIIAKIFIQSLWKINSDWDETIPTFLCTQWKDFYSNLYYLNSLSIPRHALIHDYINIEMHGFADSSMNAYGAVIYIRSVDRVGNILVHLLCAKSRVAKKETIPRLELRAASLLANLYNDTKTTLSCNFDRIYLWSDSSIVLAWIKNSTSNKLKQFVINRVNEIKSLTNVEHWHWVASSENPADLITRGIQANKIANTKMWWQGPSWLSKSQSKWPSRQIPNTSISELETLCNVSNIVPVNNFYTNLFERWSNSNKLVRILAFILRFINNLKGSRNRSPLSITELNNSLHVLVKNAQIESFPLEYSLLKTKKPLPQSSNILCLNPFMQNDVIRVGGRLALSPYCHDKKHPIILHHKHTLTKLIMQTEHIKLLHAGPQLLLSTVRERFWPTHGKSLASKIVHKCVTCFRAKPSIYNPIMGNLPKTRVTPSAPFLNTGIDYAGPFLIRNWRGRGYKTSKCYIAIFVCFATKAIHIELVSGLESQTFLAALRRFISRRGKPREMVSDNATTFHGANNDLVELSVFLREHSNELTSSCSDEGILFKFLPAYTPHMGGLHEAAVKSCKFHLKRILGQALLTYEEFSTVLIQIEGILNSRPLCPMSSNDTDFTALTPAHFLIGRSITSLPDYDYKDVPIHRLTHFQQLQQIQQDFWRRWARDYVGNLQQRTKWRSSKGHMLAAGTLVLVKDERLPSCHWKIGRIIKTHDGEDNERRIASIQTANKIIRRGFNNICPLPID